MAHDLVEIGNAEDGATFLQEGEEVARKRRKLEQDLMPRELRRQREEKRLGNQKNLLEFEEGTAGSAGS